MRDLDTRFIRYLYFSVLVGYLTLCMSIVWGTNEPGFVFKLSTTGYNFAFAFSAWHTVAINSFLLPRKLRPNLFVRAGLLLGGCYFLFLGVMAALKLAGAV